jgi:hypothetical protein
VPGFSFYSLAVRKLGSSLRDGDGLLSNFPFGDGDAESYLDNRASSTTKGRPFYSFEEENGDRTASTFSFFDNSDRDDRTDPDFIRWRGELMIASWDGSTPGHVTVYDGISWGWDLYDFAVPEPGTLGCMALGFALLITFRSARFR